MSVTYGTSVVRNGLLLNLDAGNIKSYPGSGTAWTDISGNGISATLQNSGTASFSNGYCTFAPPDMINTAAYYQITDTRISSLTSLSIECWFYITSFYANAARPFSPRVTEANSPIGFSISNGSVTWELNGSGTWQTGSASNSDCTTGRWICVQQSTDETTKLFKTYVNGQLVGSLTYTGIPNSGGGILLGRGFYGGVVNFAGRISNAKCYNRALSANEMLQNFNGQRGRYGL